MGLKDNPLQGPNHVETVKRKIISETELNFNKYRKLENLIEGPKFLITESVESVCEKIKIHSHLNDGTVLIQTQTLKQAKQLITLNRLNSDINITIKEHSRLNQSKGFVSYLYYMIIRNHFIIMLIQPPLPKVES